MKKLISEPLVQFLVLGLFLFIAHGIWAARAQSEASSIVIDAQTRARLAAVYEAEQSRSPSDEDMRALIISYVQEQALSREAMRAGLDSDDTIITRRLAQKMRFMLEDNASPSDPGDAVLRPWFEANRADFTVPEARAISHIYLSPQRGGNIETRAKAAIVQVQTNPDNWKSIGDPFMMAREFSPIDRAAMARVFGRDFTASVFELPATTGTWSAPIESAFGLHSVRLDGVRLEKSLDFEAVRAEVLDAWQDAEIDVRNAERLSDLIGKYKVVEK